MMLDWREWDRMLEIHPCQCFRSYIVKGFRVGANTSYMLRKASCNMPSTLAHHEVVAEYLATKCCEDRVIGPPQSGIILSCASEPLWSDPKGELRKVEADC